MRWATRRSTAVPSRRTNSGLSQRRRKSHCTSSKRPRTGSSSPAASSSLPPHRTVTNAMCRCRRPLRGAAIRNAFSPFPFRPTHPGSRSWRASRCRAGSGRGAIHCRCSTSRTACCSSTGCSSGGTGSMLYDPTPMVKMLGADGGSVNFNFLGWSNLCRVEVRMRLMTAVATMVAEAIGVIDYREVAAKLGEMATYCEVWRHAMEGIEHLARPTATGQWTLGPARDLHIWFTQVSGRMVELMREICASGIIMQPSERDLANPEIRQYLDRYMRGKDVDVEYKSRLFRLAHDLAASSFGQIGRA